MGDPLITRYLAAQRKIYVDDFVDGIQVKKLHGFYYVKIKTGKLVANQRWTPRQFIMLVEDVEKLFGQ